VVRSGLVEARHDVTVVAVASGGVIEATGETSDRFFLRSAAKPFQAAVSQRSGAGMGTEQLAISGGSHGGQPVHVAYVRQMLADVGLDESHLLCPPSRPMSIGSDRRLAAAGDVEAKPIYHNCSGKHAAMLRACVSRGWSLDYTDPGHALQQENRAFMEEMTGCDPMPVGVDGCGVPTMRTTVTGLATAFSRLATDPGLAEVLEAMYRYASLTADGDRSEALLARWAGGTVKGGAMACIGIAHRSGIGVAAKCWTGLMEPAVMGIIVMLRRLGLLADYPFHALAPVANPPVLGGGRPVGTFEVVED